MAESLVGEWTRLRGDTRASTNILVLENQTRQLVHAMIRDTLKREGVVAAEDTRLEVLSSAAMTDQQKLYARFYSGGQVVIYGRLRAMDALAFEKLLLESFERRGHRVLRNRRYTSDGGIDGQVIVEGRVWLIQANCYGAAIRLEHVRAFGSICTARGAKGPFIHPGRTGGNGREALTQVGAVEIVSGQRLLSLITGAPLVIGGRTL